VDVRWRNENLFLTFTSRKTLRTALKGSVVAENSFMGIFLDLEVRKRNEKPLSHFHIEENRKIALEG
jgi:hypothetical protein